MLGSPVAEERKRRWRGETWRSERRRRCEFLLWRWDGRARGRRGVGGGIGGMGVREGEIR